MEALRAVEEGRVGRFPAKCPVLSVPSCVPTCTHSISFTLRHLAKTLTKSPEMLRLGLETSRQTRMNLVITGSQNFFLRRQRQADL